MHRSVEMEIWGGVISRGWWMFDNTWRGIATLRAVALPITRQVIIDSGIDVTATTHAFPRRYHATLDNPNQ